MARLNPIDRVLTPVRTGTAALALAVALALLAKVPLIATFRAAVILLAALELLAFGRRALSTDARLATWIEIVAKLAVLTAAYVALGS